MKAEGREEAVEHEGEEQLSLYSVEHAGNLNTCCCSAFAAVYSDVVGVFFKMSQIPELCSRRRLQMTRISTELFHDVVLCFFFRKQFSGGFLCRLNDAFLACASSQVLVALSVNNWDPVQFLQWLLS